MLQDKIPELGGSIHSVFIAVDSYVDKNPGGFLWDSVTKLEYEFKNLTQLILMVQKNFELEPIPQAANDLRSFAQLGDDLSLAGRPTATCEHTGKLANFHLQFIFRQNASWQGIAGWQNKDQRVSFRSLLELVLMLDSALS